MRIISVLLLILLLFLLQSSVFGYLRIQGVVPNLLLVVFVLIAMTADPREIYPAALASGLLLDITSPFPFGIFILTFVALGFALVEAKFYLFAKANFVIFLLVVFLSTIFYYFFSIAAVEIVHFIKLPTFLFSARNILFIILPKEILYNLAAAMIIFGLFKIRKIFFIKSSRFNGFRSNF